MPLTGERSLVPAVPADASALCPGARASARTNDDVREAR
jgi:hypothetical protein